MTQSPNSPQGFNKNNWRCHQSLLLKKYPLDLRKWNANAMNFRVEKRKKKEINEEISEKEQQETTKVETHRKERVVGYDK